MLNVTKCLLATETYSLFQRIGNRHRRGDYRNNTCTKRKKISLISSIEKMKKKLFFKITLQ